MAEIITTVPVLNVDTWLADVDSRLSQRWGLPDDTCERQEAIREAAILLCLEGLTAQQAADQIGADWEPADGAMPWSGQIAWHDGL